MDGTMENGSPLRQRFTLQYVGLDRAIRSDGKVVDIVVYTETRRDGTERLVGVPHNEQSFYSLRRNDLGHLQTENRLDY